MKLAQSIGSVPLREQGPQLMLLVRDCRRGEAVAPVRRKRKTLETILILMIYLNDN